jgi:hypothetical protein
VNVVQHPYPDQPGFKARDTETSRQAAKSSGGTAELLRSQVLEALRRHCMTADEVAQFIKHDILGVRPRLSELKEMGKIAATDQRRPNKSGKNAVVWRVTGELQQEDLF